MISLTDFRRIVEQLRAAGYADDDIAWAEGLTPPASAEAFAREAIDVCSSSFR